MEQVRTSSIASALSSHPADAIAQVEDAYYLELFHGATIAFKDMALSILPYLMTTAAKKNQVKNLILIRLISLNLKEGQVYPEENLED